MGKFVKAVIGAALVVGSFAIPGIGPVLGGFLASTMLSTGLALVSSALLTPKVPGAGERQASETTLQLGERPRMVGFGEFSTGAMLLDRA